MVQKIVLRENGGEFTPLIKISLPEMSPFAEDFVITDIYICVVKKQYREICVGMQQYLCELHLCMDG